MSPLDRRSSSDRAPLPAGLAAWPAWLGLGVESGRRIAETLCERRSVTRARDSYVWECNTTAMIQGFEPRSIRVVGRFVAESFDRAREWLAVAVTHAVLSEVAGVN